jgi:hypothetical protein
MLGCKTSTARAEKDIAGAKISLLAVRDWCVQRRVNLSKFCKELSKLGILLSLGERITLGKGTTVASSRRTLSGLSPNSRLADS